MKKVILVDVLGKKSNYTLFDSLMRTINQDSRYHYAYIDTIDIEKNIFSKILNIDLKTLDHLIKKEKRIEKIEGHTLKDIKTRLSYLIRNDLGHEYPDFQQHNFTVEMLGIDSTHFSTNLENPINTVIPEVTFKKLFKNFQKKVISKKFKPSRIERLFADTVIQTHAENFVLLGISNIRLPSNRYKIKRVAIVDSKEDLLTLKKDYDSYLYSERMIKKFVESIDTVTRH